MFKRQAKEPKEPKAEPTYEEKMLDMAEQQLRCLQSLRENIRFMIVILVLAIGVMLWGACSAALGLVR